MCVRVCVHMSVCVCVLGCHDNRKGNEEGGEMTLDGVLMLGGLYVFMCVYVYECVYMCNCKYVR